MKNTHIFKMSQWPKGMIKLLIVLVISLILINILTIAHFQRNIRERETTVIFNEILRKGSGGHSSSDKTADTNVDKTHNNAQANKDTAYADDDAEDADNDDEKTEDDKERLASTNNENLPHKKFIHNQASVKLNYVEDVAEEYDMKDETIDAMIEKLERRVFKFFPSYFQKASLFNLTRLLGASKRLYGKHLTYYAKKKGIQEGLPNWKKVHRNVRQFALYDPDDPAVDGLLHDMATQPFIEAEENDGGTELKLTMRFKDDGRAILKPMRYPREIETDPNHYIFDDIERHIAEIAAFHLDRILGFFRVPPTVGRIVNITSEIEPLVAESFSDTIYMSPAGNKCFFGKCDVYCDSAHAFCGKPDVIEVSLMSYLPSQNVARRSSWYQPYQRSYSKFRKAYWEKHDDLCDKLKKEYPYNNGKLLTDMVDSHTFDFLTGNKDRHSFLFFKEFGNYSFPIMYDNGRGFGRKTYDAMSILAPLRQCCIIRKTTLLKYIKLYSGPDKLSDLMEKSLKNDPIAPVLLRGHLTSLDRRLLKILQAVAKCIEDNRKISSVIIDDHY